MGRSAAGQPANILLVEDNPGDVRLTREAFREGTCATNIHVVTDGIEALSFLRQEGSYQEAVRPDLVLLDLNLPKMSGREVLAEIKRDERLKRIPVVILTTSQADEDVMKAYELHANCYMVKPVDMDQFLQAVRVLEDFWLSVVKLPPG